MTVRRETERACPPECGALCCKYIVRKIPAPRTRRDFDELYWFLCHEKVAVYVEQRGWYLLVEVACQHLDRKLRCRIYPERPDVCRLHARQKCEYTGKIEFQEFFCTPEDLVLYLKRKGRRLRVPWAPGSGLGLSLNPEPRVFQAAARDPCNPRGHQKK
jgi:uncharacterized protein